MSKSKINKYSISTISNQDDRIVCSCRDLNLIGILSTYKKVIQASNCEKLTYYDFLELVLQKEILYKEESRIQRWIQQARFPYRKTLEDFDFSFNQSIKVERIKELASCRFIEEKGNIIFLGPPGIGKTHLSIALGLEAINKGYETRFITLKELVDVVRKTSKTNDIKIERLSSSLLRPKLLILDEMDLHQITAETSDLLFHILYQRFEKSSTIFTSNRSILDWKDIFGDKIRTVAMIDRLSQFSIINIKGKSYRLEHRINL